MKCLNALSEVSSIKLVSLPVKQTDKTDVTLCIYYLSVKAMPLSRF